jgi:NAD(P)-dependent dehydrogenase (short-subunit alcohol dehydrogenase family)
MRVTFGAQSVTFSAEVAWVTGGGTGIGRAVALKLAERGCDVAVNFNRSEAEAREVAERSRLSEGMRSSSGATWPTPRTWRVWPQSSTSASEA